MQLKRKLIKRYSSYNKSKAANFLVCYRIRIMGKWLKFQEMTTTLFTAFKTKLLNKQRSNIGNIKIAKPNLMANFFISNQP